ncbi:MAG: hypothetical protein ACYDBH_01095 [Acidobacteriaceae bacterium]
MGHYMKLALGVDDIPYANPDNPNPKTTFEVASILEGKYNVMETFYVSREEKIADFLADGMAQAIQQLAKTGRVIDPYFRAGQKIKDEFTTFINNQEMSALIASMSEGETKAFNWMMTFDSSANAGHSSRKKHSYAKGKPRPAFVDTGTYLRSFRAWIEE